MSSGRRHNPLGGGFQRAKDDWEGLKEPLGGGGPEKNWSDGIVQASRFYSRGEILSITAEWVSNKALSGEAGCVNVEMEEVEGQSLMVNANPAFL